METALAGWRVVPDAVRAADPDFEPSHLAGQVLALASSLLENGGRVEDPKGWKWRPGSTVLGLVAGDVIVVYEAAFTTLDGPT